MGRDEPAGADQLDAAARRLAHAFPDVPRDAVRSLLSDSYRTLVEATGLEHTVPKAEQLTELRLEVLTRHPARHPHA